MRLLIVGANGRLGRLLVEQGLAAGHDVGAFVRSPASFTITDSRLTVVAGDLTDAEAVRAAVSGWDAVLAVVAAPPRKATTLFSAGAENLIAAMGQHGIRRLLWVTSAGVDPIDAAAQGLLFNKIIRPLLLKQMYADAGLSEKLLLAADIDWTVLHPPALNDGEGTGTYRVEVPHVPTGGKNISRADLAGFMLKVAVGGDYVRQIVAISY